MRTIKAKSIYLAGALLAGCSASIDDYQNNTPALHLDQFFNGRLEAYGMVQDFRGRVIRRFRADIHATWNGNQGVLDEQFFFDDGEHQQRCWKLTKDGNHYTGVAGDVIGTAEGVTRGNALNWHYTLAVTVNGKERHLQLNDWLYLIDEDNLLNRATMSKFGIPVGKITLSIHRLKTAEPKNLWSVCDLKH